MWCFCVQRTSIPCWISLGCVCVCVCRVEKDFRHRCMHKNFLGGSTGCACGEPCRGVSLSRAQGSPGIIFFKFGRRNVHMYFVTEQGNEVLDRDQACGLFSQTRGRKQWLFANWFTTQNTPVRQLEASEGTNSIIPILWCWSFCFCQCLLNRFEGAWGKMAWRWSPASNRKTSKYSSIRELNMNCLILRKEK